MSNRWDAIDAMHRRLGTDGNPLLDLRCLDRAMAQKMEDHYTALYLEAKDGDETPVADRFNAMFDSFFSGEPVEQTKGDVLAAWEVELRNAFPKAFMQDYTREEAKTFLNLLNKKHVDGSVSLQLSNGFCYNMFALMDGWNATHPNAEPLQFTGYGDYMP